MNRHRGSSTRFNDYTQVRGKALNGLKYRKIIPTSKLVMVTLIRDFNMYCDHVKIQEKNLEKSDTVP